MISRLAVGAAALAAATVTIVMLGPAAYASEPGSGIDLEPRTEQAVFAPGEPVRLTFAVTNDSGTECGLTAVSVGVVQVISVRRDGVELVPSLGRSFYPDGIGAQIVSGDRMTPAYLGTFLKAEIEKWAAPIKAAGVQVD